MPVPPPIDRETRMKAAFLHPKHPERTCWGCDRLCAATDLGCGNGTVRTQHPMELLGDDWLEFEETREDANGRQLEKSGGETDIEGENSEKPNV